MGNRDETDDCPSFGSGPVFSDDSKSQFWVLKIGLIQDFLKNGSKEFVVMWNIDEADGYPSFGSTPVIWNNLGIDLAVSNQISYSRKTNGYVSIQNGYKQ